MSNDKKSSRWAGLFFAVLVIILSALSMFFYSKNGINLYSSSLNSKVFVFCGLAIACAMISLIADRVPIPIAEECVRPALAVAFLLLLYAILQYVNAQINFVGAVFAAIDVDQYGPLVPGFIWTIGSMGLGALCAMLGCALGKKKA